jgi:DNA modification methylase
VLLRLKAKEDYLSLTLDEAKQLYFSNPLNPPNEFELYYNQKRDQLTEHLTVNLSNVCIQADCIEYMLRPDNIGRFDHIITDPQYGFDTDMMDQTNYAMQDIDRIADTHQVEIAKATLVQFFPAAFKCTKDKAFVITCCDIMLWQFMYDLAIGAGFAVQRWPIIWRKVNQALGNSCAMFNTTKDYEIAMVCRKPTTTLATKMNTSIVEASNSDVTRITGHPFAKPFEFTRALCEAVSLPDQLILEPFAGGGSMAIEMLNSKRNVVCVEKETHHYNALLENLKQQYYLRLNPKFLFK